MFKFSKIIKCIWVYIIICLLPQIDAKIIKTDSASIIGLYLSSIAQDTAVFFNIHNTLVATKAKMFRPGSPDNNFFLLLKQCAEFNFEVIFSSWLLQRKIILLSTFWPKIVDLCKTQTNMVYGITDMTLGSFGRIKRIEFLRYSELEQLGIVFSTNYNGIEESNFLLDENTETSKGLSGNFYRGIFFAGSSSKVDIIQQFLSQHLIDKLVFVDSDAKSLIEIEKTCIQYNVKFIGFIFSESQLLSQKPTLKFLKNKKIFF